MARKPREVYSREEVNFMLSIVAAQTLNMVTESILTSGAPPSPEVGVAVMHFAAGVKYHNSILSETGKALQLSEERGQELQAVVKNVLGN